MSAFQYIKESAEKPRRFKNGTIKLELCAQGIMIRGTKELPEHPGVLTFGGRLLHWTLLEVAKLNTLEVDIALLVDDLGLEADDASI